MKVILCCSGGMTSGFFKEKMQNYILKNNLPLIIEGAAVHTVEKKCPYYDVVLLAPQMGYKKEEIETLTHKYVGVIDPQSLRHMIVAHYTNRFNITIGGIKNE